MSVYETVMQAILARLQASPALDAEEIKRAHKTAVPRDKSPAVHLLESDDEPERNSANKCTGTRYFSPTVRVLVRDDDGYADADALVLDVIDRLNGDADAYANGVTVELGRVYTNEEIADADALVKEIELRVSYRTASPWSLQAA